MKRTTLNEISTSVGGALVACIFVFGSNPGLYSEAHADFVEPPITITEEDVCDASPEYQEEIVIDIQPETTATDEEIELIARLTMAEAEGEPEEGQRLVIDSILNRMDSPSFPNTINNVIYQKNQYSAMWNGRIDRCVATDSLIELVEDELNERTDHSVVYFRTGHYSSYGSPVKKVGHHYFSAE